MEGEKWCSEKMTYELGYKQVPSRKVCKAQTEGVRYT